MYVLSENIKKNLNFSNEIFNFCFMEKSLYIVWVSFRNGFARHESIVHVRSVMMPLFSNVTFLKH